jgi:hypothetical protein
VRVVLAVAADEFLGRIAFDGRDRGAEVLNVVVGVDDGDAVRAAFDQGAETTFAVLHRLQ